MSSIFYSDVAARKKLTASSFCKKRGSKSKKCTLSSDRLTNAQWKKRNGDIIVFQMNLPTNWNNFKNISRDLQEEYLQKLVDRYGVTQDCLSQMLGISKVTLRKLITEINAKQLFSKGKKMDNDQKRRWNEFLENAGFEPKFNDIEPDQPIAPAEPVESNQEEVIIPPSPIVEDELTMRFSGNNVYHPDLAEFLKERFGGRKIRTLIITASFES